MLQYCIGWTEIILNLKCRTQWATSDGMFCLLQTTTNSISSEEDAESTAEWYSPREFLSPNPAAARHARHNESRAGADGNDEGIPDEDSMPKPDRLMVDAEGLAGAESRVPAETQDTALLLGDAETAVLPGKVS